MYLRFSEYDASLLKRPAEGRDDIAEAVRSIVSDVRRRGDEALRDYALRFDGSSLDSLFVSEREFEEAEAAVPDDLKAAIRHAGANIRRFHEAERPQEECVETEEGVVCSRRVVPIRHVGLYVPGGTAPLFSTVLMLAIPAVVAGCQDIILATPAKNGAVSPAILYAASSAGVRKVLKVGGAQAIAAFAYGTESVPRRDKIFGPGNSYVTEAKRQVSSDTAIDMLAGPSEVMVVIDRSSDPAYAAADLLSQAEHGRDSQAMLLIRSDSLAEAASIHSAVEKAIGEELALIGRHEYMLPSLSHSFAFPFHSDDDMVDAINAYAPEHLILSTANADELAERVENAGSVFVGSYTPESAGDYASGTNHTLPTSGWARSSSGVSLDSFLKKITFQRITGHGLANLGRTIMTMAEAEGLAAHSYAVKVRVGDGI